MSFTERKRAMLQKRLAELNEEWEAVYAQIGRELNEASKLRLQRQADGIEQEIAGLEAQLRLPEGSDESTPAATSVPAGEQGEAAKYNITITGGQGFVIGDQAAVTQQFPPRADTNPINIPPVDNAHLVALADQISRYFDLGETRDLCFRLGIEYDDVGGEGKSGRVRELVRLVERNGRLPELLPHLQKLRPHVKWE